MWEPTRGVACGGAVGSFWILSLLDLSVPPRACLCVRPQLLPFSSIPIVPHLLDTPHLSLTLTPNARTSPAHQPAHHLAVFEMEAKSADATTPYFAFGSNSIEQLRERCQNPNLTARKAFLPGYRRIFAGSSKKWEDSPGAGGGVASLVDVSTTAKGGDAAEAAGDRGCIGSAVDLTDAEFELLDRFEGIPNTAAVRTEHTHTHARIAHTHTAHTRTLYTHTVHCPHPHTFNAHTHR